MCRNMPEVFRIFDPSTRKVLFYEPFSEEEHKEQVVVDSYTEFFFHLIDSFKTRGFKFVEPKTFPEKCLDVPQLIYYAKTGNFESVKFESRRLHT